MCCRITPDGRRQVALRYAISLFSLALSFPAGSFGQQEPDTAGEVTPRYDSMDVTNWKECVLRMDPVSCPTDFKAMVESLQKEGKGIAPELLMLYSELKEAEARLGRELTPLYDNMDGSNWEECLRLDPVFCPTVLKAEVEGLQKEGIEVPPELQLLYDRLKAEEERAPVPLTVVNQCHEFGQILPLSVPNCIPFVPGSQSILYWIGDDDCNGRCGAGCPSGVPDCVDNDGGLQIHRRLYCSRRLCRHL